MGLVALNHWVFGYFRGGIPFIFTALFVVLIAAYAGQFGGHFNNKMDSDQIIREQLLNDTIAKFKDTISKQSKYKTYQLFFC